MKLFFFFSTLLFLLFVFIFFFKLGFLTRIYNACMLKAIQGRQLGEPQTLCTYSLCNSEIISIGLEFITLLLIFTVIMSSYSSFSLTGTDYYNSLLIISIPVAFTLLFHPYYCPSDFSKSQI